MRTSESATPAVVPVHPSDWTLCGGPNPRFDVRVCTPDGISVPIEDAGPCDYPSGHHFTVYENEGHGPGVDSYWQAIADPATEEDALAIVDRLEAHFFRIGAARHEHADNRVFRDDVAARVDEFARLLHRRGMIERDERKTLAAAAHLLRRQPFMAVPYAVDPRHCVSCGSHEIALEVIAVTDEVGRVEVVGVCDKGHACNRCGGEKIVVESPAESAA